MALGKPVVTFLHDEAVERTEEAFGTRGAARRTRPPRRSRTRLRPLVEDRPPSAAASAPRAAPTSSRSTTSRRSPTACSTSTLGSDALPAADLRRSSPATRDDFARRVGRAGRPAPARTRLRGSSAAWSTEDGDRFVWVVGHEDFDGRRRRLLRLAGARSHRSRIRVRHLDPEPDRDGLPAQRAATLTATCPRRPDQAAREAHGHLRDRRARLPDPRRPPPAAVHAATSARRASARSRRSSR